MGSRAHRYELYGLEIQSERALPGLRPSRRSAGQPDVSIEFTSAVPDAADPHPRRFVSETHLVTIEEVGPGRDTLLAYEGGASTFVVDRRGRWIRVIHTSDPLAEDTLRFLLGSVMGWLLRARGTTLLHAAVLAHRERGFALIGASGSGKSTLSTALLREGCCLVSDDVLALRHTERGYEALPGLARIRLWQDAADRLLGLSASALPLAHSRPKRLWNLSADDERLQPDPCPVSGLYLLHPDGDAPDEPRIERPEGGTVLLSLLANTYPSVEHHPLESEVRAREFQVLASLVAEVPLRRIVYGRRLSSLPAVCRAILGDLASREDGPSWSPRS